MGIYSRQILPRMLSYSMAGKFFHPYRKEVLAQAEGIVLEIGFGSGLNLPFYPSRVNKIVTVEPNPGMNSLARKRIKASAIPVESHQLSGERLPFEDDTFDTVVSTWTLCTIPAVEQALAEVGRVLKPGGKFLFVEHGLSPEPNVQKWQNRMTPLQKAVGDGCHLNRPMRQLIEQSLRIQSIKEYNVTEKGPAILQTSSYFYQGIAIPK